MLKQKFEELRAERVAKYQASCSTLEQICGGTHGYARLVIRLFYCVGDELVCQEPC